VTLAVPGSVIVKTAMESRINADTEGDEHVNAVTGAQLVPKTGTPRLKTSGELTPSAGIFAATEKAIEQLPCLRPRRFSRF
jgi:hypothetical protein